jgi:hypothetical protein
MARQRVQQPTTTGKALPPGSLSPAAAPEGTASASVDQEQRSVTRSPLDERIARWAGFLVRWNRTWGSRALSLDEIDSLWIPPNVEDPWYPAFRACLLGTSTAEHLPALAYVCDVLDESGYRITWCTDPIAWSLCTNNDGGHGLVAPTKPTNVPDSMRAMTEEDRAVRRAAWGAFFQRWSDIFQTAPVGPKEIAELWHPDDDQEDGWYRPFTAYLRGEREPDHMSAMEDIHGVLSQKRFSLKQRPEHGTMAWSLHVVVPGVDALTPDQRPGRPGQPGCPHDYVKETDPQVDLPVYLCKYCRAVDWEVLAVSIRQFTQEAIEQTLVELAPPNSVIYTTSGGGRMRVDDGQTAGDPRERAMLMGLLSHSLRTTQAFDQRGYSAPVAAQAHS